MSAASSSAPTAVVAIGGNALIIDAAHESIHDQSLAAAATSRHIADMVESGLRVVVTHGSGPQVGFILRRSELAIDEVPPVPMDYADADLQGGIGFMFQCALRNEMNRRGIDRGAVAVITQVLVDRDDASFAAPTKPIGSYMDEATAVRRRDEFGWEFRPEGARGWRRVVASPAPRAIVDLEPIRLLVEAGLIVIACGGGGIPVIRHESGALQGVEAVIDKDLSSSLLARDLGADLFVIATPVERVALDFGTADQRWLDRMTVSEARRHLADGQFPAGSMGPKIEAMVAFVAATGRIGVVTDCPNLHRAAAGETGTRIVPDQGVSFKTLSD